MLVLLRRGVVLAALILVVEFLVVPRLIGAGRNLDLLGRIHPGWLVAGVCLEAGSLLCYALLTHALLPGGGPPVTRLLRITLATTALEHSAPGGMVTGPGLGYRLLTEAEVSPADAGVLVVGEAVGSAVMLNALLWVALLASIPLAGLTLLDVVAAGLGLAAMLGAAALVLAFTRGEDRAVRAVRWLGRRLPRVGADRLERAVRQVGDALTHLARSRAVLWRACLWAALNWLLDAASLWAFLAAFGWTVQPVELFVAYGVANVLAVIPIAPAGLGIIEATTASLLVEFGVPAAVATLGVLGWRLINFWLPIPVGAASYVSLRLPRKHAGGVRRTDRASAGDSLISASVARTTEPAGCLSPSTSSRERVTAQDTCTTTVPATSGCHAGRRAATARDRDRRHQAACWSRARFPRRLRGRAGSPSTSGLPAGSTASTRLQSRSTPPSQEAAMDQVKSWSVRIDIGEHEGAREPWLTCRRSTPTTWSGSASPASILPTGTYRRSATRSRSHGRCPTSASGC